MAKLPQKDLIYKPACAVLAKFHASKAQVRVVRACRGSGKSTAMMVDLYVQATTMPPQRDNVRRSAFLISRTSYRDLAESALKSFVERFGGTPGMSEVRGKEPWEIRFQLDMPDGTKVDSLFTFMAVDDDSLGKLGSIQYTSVYLNELIDWGTPSIVNAVMASCGRYPSKDGFDPAYIAECERLDKPIYPSGVIIDTNGPFEDSWVRKAETNPPAGWAFFIQAPPLVVSDQPQPGAVEHDGLYYSPNPLATFAKVQPKSYRYWTDLLANSEQHFLESRIMGEYSKTMAGRKVYPEFAEDMIVRSNADLSAFRGHTLYIGVDTSGLHPAAVLGFYKDAALWVVDEVGAEDIAFNSYVEDFLIPVLAGKYSDFEMVAFCDPSNPASALSKVTAMSVLLDTGLDARLAPTNHFGDRAMSVRTLLNKRDGFYIYPAAETLLRGFRGAYLYEPVRGKPGIHKVSPKKNVESDYHDALQYLALGLQLETGRRKIAPVKFPTRNRRVV